MSWESFLSDLETSGWP
jgi:hypothetical protein